MAARARQHDRQHIERLERGRKTIALSVCFADMVERTITYSRGHESCQICRFAYHAYAIECLPHATRRSAPHDTMSHDTNDSWAYCILLPLLQLSTRVAEYPRFGHFPHRPELNKLVGQPSCQYVPHEYIQLHLTKVGDRAQYPILDACAITPQQLPCDPLICCSTNAFAVRSRTVRNRLSQ